MASIYSLLAPFYDHFNRDVPYKKLAAYYQEIFQKYEHGKTSLVLDLGCGTGNVTIPLSNLGYDMIGLDLSPDMLNIAQKQIKKKNTGKDILLLCQDMTSFELYGTVEGCVCSLDGINHLDSLDDVKKTFELVHNYLSPDGLFCFDVNSKYKFETIYSNEVYTFEDTKATCIWQNDYQKKNRSCDFYITLFEKQKDGRYIRHDACETEHYYSEKELDNLLLESGFEILEKTGDIMHNKVSAQSEKIYYVARCIK